MPVYSNKRNGNATVRLSSNVTLAFTDLSLPLGEADLGGTIAVVDTQANVIGTGTSFTTKFANGDFMFYVGNSTSNVVVQINQVVNATFMNVVGSTTGTNAAITDYRHAETIEAVDIKEVKWSANGASQGWIIKRGSNTVMELFGSGWWPMEVAETEFRGGTIVANTTASTGGTLILELSKKLRAAANNHKIEV